MATRYKIIPNSARHYTEFSAPEKGGSQSHFASREFLDRPILLQKSARVYAHATIESKQGDFNLMLCMHD
jgi:hypothetical protein